MDQLTSSQHGDTVGRRPRLSETVANRLSEEILADGLRAGERLPTEREIGERFGVSRTVVREAIRTLGGRGLIEARPGRGLTVAEVPASTVTDSMNLFLRTSAGLIPYAKVHEVRASIEVEVAGYAAARATHVGAAQLREIHERMGETIALGDNAAQLDVDFHRQLATLTRNELYVIMLDSIGDVLLEVRNATWREPSVVGLAYELHGAILAAVEARDPDAARNAMREHLDQGLTRWELVAGERARNEPATPRDSSGLGA
jgi:DNA-binding FadR family transcriptional regulator